MKFSDMRSKEVICARDGQRLGFVSDMEFDENTGRISSIIVPGAYRYMGVFGREDDVVIEWERITTIGEDLIIIEPKYSLDKGE
ncbi:MAG: YlmC/YmxH family sporulation protein [Clostridiales bacterium]|nr:YlmC/YmxH family sporulation protein [Clostridiales bacterium]